MKVLVTGGAGFIGSHVVDRLCELGHEPVVFDALLPAVHLAGSWPDYLRTDVERWRGDVRDDNAIGLAMRGCGAVIHLAAAVGVGESAYRPAHYTDHNTRGTAVLLESLIDMPRDKRPQRLVVAGSMSSYGEGLYEDADGRHVEPLPRSDAEMELHNWELPGLTPIPTPEHKRFDLRSVYAQTKRDQEDMSLIVGEQQSLSVAVPRFFNVYGERQALSNPYTGVAAIFSAQIANDNAPRVYEDGHQSRDFIHVSDVARAVCQLAVGDAREFVGPVNIGTGQQTTIAQLATALLKLYGKPSLGLNIRHQYRSGDIRHCYADVSRLRDALGGDWSTVPLADGLERLADWAETQTADDNTARAHRELVQRGLLK